MARRNEITVKLTDRELAHLDAHVYALAAVGNPKTRDQLIGYLLTAYLAPPERTHPSPPADTP